MERLGKVYRIDNDINSDFYIGSTIQPLSTRISKHRNHAKDPKFQHRALYKLMSEIGLEHFKIYMIEEVTHKKREELLAREGHYIRTLKPSLNKRVAGRTNAEWHEDNRDYHIEQMNKYNNLNKDKIIEYRKQYYLENKAKMLEQQKKYRESKKLYLDTLKDVNNTPQDRNEDSDGYITDYTDSSTEDTAEDL